MTIEASSFGASPARRYEWHLKMHGGHDFSLAYIPSPAGFHAVLAAEAAGRPIPGDVNTCVSP